MSINKNLIVVAVTATLSHPATSNASSTGPTLYGRINLGVMVDDSGDDTITDVYDVASRFGIKGDEDLGNGLSAIYQYEFGVNADRGNLRVTPEQRLSYVGLKGGFGQLSLGTQWGAFYNMVGTHLDPTYTLGYLGYSLYMGGDYRISNSVQYSGNFGPVAIQADLQLDGDNPAEDNIDRYQLGASYTVAGFTLAAAFDSYTVGIDTDGDGAADAKGDDSIDNWAVAAKYASENFDLAVGYMETDGSDVGGNERQMWTINGNYYIGKTRLYAQYYDGSSDTDADTEEDGNEDSDLYLFGIQHDF